MKKLLAVGAALAGLSALAATSASALPVNLLDPDGTTTFEDDSGEFLLRPNSAGGFDPVTSGDIAIGDLFLGVLDISSIGGTSLDTVNTEITGVFLTEVTNLTDFDDETIGLTTFDTVDVTFGARPDLFMELFGVPDQAADTVALLWEDTDDDFSFFSSDVTDIAGSIPTATDGSLFMRLLLDDDGFFTSNDVPLDPSTFGLFPSLTQLGTFAFDLFIADYFGPGVLQDDRTFGSGNLIVPQDGNVFPVENDLQFTVEVIPVPGTLGLLGIGLIGIGAAARRRQRA